MSDWADALGDERIARREERLGALVADGGAERLRRALEDVWPSLDATARRRAIEYVSRRWGGEATPIISRALKDPSWVVREAAARLLSARRAEWTAEIEESLLARLVDDSHRLVRESALRTLAPPGVLPEGVLAARLVERLTPRLTDRRPPVRARAARMLAQVCGPLRERVVALLAPALVDSHRKVRQAVVEALATLSPESLAVAGELVRRRWDGEPRVAEASRRALGQLADHAGETWLAECLRSISACDFEHAVELRDRWLADPRTAEVLEELQRHVARRRDWSLRAIPEARLASADEPAKQAVWELGKLVELGR